MKQILHLTALLLAGSLTAQTVLLDFETAGTSTTYQYFGSTLDGSVNNIIANPDASGANTSATVAEHVKPANSEVWAGAFPNPALPIPADLTTDNRVCLKVWAPATGNVGIKLEGSATAANWVRTVEVPQAMSWVEVCVDANLPSLEGPFLPAVGHVYPTVTLFFDFGTNFPEDKTYYWDDLLTTAGGGATDGDITLSVDMNGYGGSFTTVFVSGTFNGWSGDANPLSDADADGIWEATIPNVPTGLQEYKFQLDNWTAQEQFNGFETCVQVDPSGQFVNRKLVVTGDEVLPTVCFNSCYACGDAVNITFAVGSSHITVSGEGLYIAGGGNFGNPGDFPLKDDNGDGVWEITVERQKGFQSFYTFTNGACPDYSCKENIAGLDCANPDNFNDRKVGPVTQDTTIATCFGLCTVDTDCGGGSGGTVKFAVDMNGYTGTFTTAFISGSFNGWSGDANPLADSDGDNIWEVSLPLAAGTYEYKFQLDNWTTDEQFADGDPCTVTDPSGQFVNRVITVDGDQEVCFQWNTCEGCLSNTLEQVPAAALFDVFPTLVRDRLNLRLLQPQAGPATVVLTDATARTLQVLQANGSGNLEIGTAQLPAGMYFLQVRQDGKAAAARFIKQ